MSMTNRQIPRTRLRVGAAAAAAVALSLGLSGTAARAADVGYVASLVGGADLEVGKEKAELSFLDFVPDGARVLVEAGSELRICLHGSLRVVSVTGPAVIRTVGGDLVSESGTSPARSGESCSRPVVSRVQGGSAFRSFASSSVAVAPRSWLRVAPAGKLAVRRATLMSPDERTRVAEFANVSVSPVVLSVGQVYPLEIELADGRKLVVKLAPDASVLSEVAVINVTP